MSCERVANAIFLKAIIANKAGAKAVEDYYRFALEWYEFLAELD